MWRKLNEEQNSPEKITCASGHGMRGFDSQRDQSFLVFKKLEVSRSQQCMARGEPQISLLRSQLDRMNSETWVLVVCSNIWPNLSRDMVEHSD